MKSATIALLLMSSAEGRHRHVKEMLELQTQTDLQIGLGSLEGAYLAQKMKKMEGGDKLWDESVLGDASQYSQGVSQSMAEQTVDIEFAEKPQNEAAQKQDQAVPKSKKPEPIGLMMTQNQQKSHKKSHHKKHHKKQQKVKLTKEEETSAKILAQEAANDQISNIIGSKVLNKDSKYEDSVKEFDKIEHGVYAQDSQGRTQLRHASDDFVEGQKNLAQYFHDKHQAIMQLRHQEDAATIKLNQIEQKEKVLKKKQAKELNDKIQKMNTEWNSFCQTLELQHWDGAQKMWSKLSKEGHQQPVLKTNTKELYQKSFNFEEIGKNDDVLNILSDLDVAQGDLNQNPDNEGLLSKFISTAQDTQVTLNKKYSQFWTNPGAAMILAEKEKTESKKAKEEKDDEDQE